MTNKLYKKIRNLLKENISIVIVVILFLLSFIEFPYYINGSGGKVNLDKKVVIKDEYKKKGSFNMLYVSEYKANIYSLILGYLNPYMDVIKKEDYVVDNDTYEDMNYRQILELEESLDNAVILGFKLAKMDVNITSSKTFVTYVFSDALTDLKVRDQIISVGSTKVSTRSEISNAINKYNNGDKISIKVINDGKEYERYAYVFEIDGYKYIGVYLTEDIDYKTPKEIKFKFGKRESGPSGGAMLALEIYNSLVEEDITKGYKIAGTGMIDSVGNILPIGGVKYKVRAASKCKIMFVPEENYEEAIEEKEKKKYKVDIVKVGNIYDILNYLKEL